MNAKAPIQPHIPGGKRSKFPRGCLTAIDLLVTICGLLLVVSEASSRRTFTPFPTIDPTALGSPAVRTALAGTLEGMRQEIPYLSAATPPAAAEASATMALNLTLEPAEPQLPFNDQNVESKYCRGYAGAVPASDAQGLTDEAIVREAVARWLAYFNTPEAPDWCRIAGYRIDDIYYDVQALAPTVEPQGDIMRVVRFSVKLVQMPNDWMSLAGEVDPKNWLHVIRAVAILRSDKGYTMQFATP